MAGGRLIGVTIARFLSIARKDADEMITAVSLGERKRMMIERGSAIAVLPGGIGTADELMEVLERKKQGEHSKPVVVLNTDDFYRGIHLQLKKMYNEGFIPMPLENLVYFAKTPHLAIEYIASALHK